MKNELREKGQPETAQIVTNALAYIASGMDKARKERLSKKDNTQHDNEPSKLDDLDGASSVIEIDKQARSIVKKYFKVDDNVTAIDTDTFQ